jgi:prepilin-type N-terminal cleavage/methylation domain-containing protein
MQNKKSELRKSRVWNNNSAFRNPHSSFGGLCMMKNLISGFKYSAIRNPHSAFQRGFTLIEIIVVIVILSIVAAISIKFVADSLRIYTMTVNQKTLFDEGKLALERMCRDIRDARLISNPAAGGSGNMIRVTRTHDTAPSQDVAGEQIRFRLTGNVLEKVKNNTGPPIATLASNVSIFTVTRGQAATNNTNEITLVLTLSLTSGENVTLQTKVYPKNLARDTTYTYKNFIRNWQEDRSL